MRQRDDRVTEGRPTEIPGAALPEELHGYVGHLLRRVYARFTAEALRDDPQSRDLVVLGVLADQDATSQTELAERLGTNRTIMVRLLDRLEERGYVPRSRNPANRRSYPPSPTPTGRDPRDRRRYALELTPAARERLRTIREAVQRLQAANSAAVGPEDEPELRALLTKPLPVTDRPRRPGRPRNTAQGPPTPAERPPGRPHTTIGPPPGHRHTTAERERSRSQLLYKASGFLPPRASERLTASGAGRRYHDGQRALSGTAPPPYAPPPDPAARPGPAPNRGTAHTTASRHRRGPPPTGGAAPAKTRTLMGYSAREARPPTPPYGPRRVRDAGATHPLASRVASRHVGAHMRVTPLGLSISRKRFRRSPQIIFLIALALIASAYLSFLPKSSAATPVLLSQGKPATASSTQDAFTAGAAVDGDPGTRWSSAASDPQWLQVDLGSSQAITQVTLNWETAYGKSFQIQTSDNGSTWNNIYSTTTGTGGNQTLAVTGTGRYVRMYGTARGTQWGYSLWEFQVYGAGSSTPPATCATTTAALGKPATASSTENAGTPASAAFDGNAGTRWSSAASDPQWVQVDLGTSQTICGAQLTWEAAYAKSYQIQVSDNGSTWNNAYSTTTGAGGQENLTFNATGRYVRMYGTVRATVYGYSLWEFTLLTPGGTSTTTPPSGGNGNCPWVGSTAPVATRVGQVMAQMTNAQKVSILHGNNNASPYIGNITGIPSLCIPNIGLQDGPHGVGDGMDGATQMPSANSAAATFDDTLEQQYGAAIGAEFAGKGVQVALGPTLNIVRDPRWGRSFETFSEDPYLNGRLAAADIRGIQSQGVMAEMKHVAVYNIENPAGTVVVDKRTMQELYLPAFQAAVQQGSPAAAMCAYSIVNSVPACQNPDLMNTGLYQQANFGGFITSDWGGTHATAESANAGLTVEMPNGYFFADFLAQAVASGTVSQATLDTMVSRLLTQFFAFGLFDKAPSGSTGATVTTPAHVAVALQGAEEGAVLLKNNGILPLSTSTTHSIAVIGWDGGAGVQSIGGGSATVRSSKTVWPITGMQNRVAGTGTTVAYNDATNLASAVTLARSSNVAIVYASDNYGNEEHDNTTIDLPNNGGGSTVSQNDMIAQVAAANPNTIVVLNNNSAINMPWLNQVAGVFESFYPGEQIGTAMAALIFGDVNPSGKLPVTFPKSLADVPANTPAQWPGVNGSVQYSEGLKVGYRWYDAQNIAPLFPFGFGLSYTTFGYSNLQVGALSGGNSTVHVTVTNTGSRAGTDVAQLYVGDPASTGEPVHQLRGYQRVTLNPGQAQTLTFTVSTHDLAYWNTGTNNWTTAAGNYQILAGNSSRNLPVTGTLNVPTTVNGVMAATVSPKAAAIGPAATAAPLSVPNPYGMSSPAHKSVSWTFDPSATTGTTYTATGLPAGISLSSAGKFTGAATTTGTYTVTVTAKNAAGSSGSATFVWTTT